MASGTQPAADGGAVAPPRNFITPPPPPTPTSPPPAPRSPNPRRTMMGSAPEPPITPTRPPRRQPQQQHQQLLQFQQPLQQLQQPQQPQQPQPAPFSFAPAGTQQAVDPLAQEWAGLAEAQAIRRAWNRPVRQYRVAVSSRIRAAWDQYDLDKPLFKSRKDEDDKSLRFNYARK